MTKETQLQQYQLTIDTIKDLEQDTDHNIKLLKAIDSLKGASQRSVISTILETRLTINYIELDFCAAYCQYLSAKTNYEQRFACKGINTILSEGYKKLYGFTAKEDSFWKKQIKFAVEHQPELHEEYLRITNDLESLQTKEVFNKEMRDISVHYDFDPRKVYQMLAKISAEEVVRRYIEFALILKEIRNFLLKLIDKSLAQ
jgi:hypothetical protein